MTTVFQQPPQRPMAVINIPLDEWVENDGLGHPGDQLHYVGRLVINGVDMHLEAIRVNPIDGPGYTMEAAGEELADGFNAIWTINGADGPLMTWTAPNGQDYVLVATPHTD